MMTKCKVFSRIGYKQLMSFSDLAHPPPIGTCNAIDTGPYPRSYTEEAALYVHWPYCRRRCTYCNFNKYISERVDQKRLRNYFTREARTLLQIAQVRRVSSIYFGGGTPSLAEPDTIQAIIETIAEEADLDESAEITMEANPSSLDFKNMEKFKAAGVNRLSLGLQVLDDKVLHLLNRDHTSLEGLASLEIARGIFPQRTSVDVLFGTPGQSVRSWCQDLEHLIPMLDNHVSLYQLTVERGTKLFKEVESSEVSLPNTNEMADMYDVAVKILEKHGLSQYEVSNFARGTVHQSEHNKCYWYGKQYIGIGPGAHGRFVPQGLGLDCREARVQTLEPNPWMWEVEKRGHGTRRRVVQSRHTVLSELIAGALRTCSGLQWKHWNLLSNGISLYDCFYNSRLLQYILDEKLLVLEEDKLYATHAGLRVLDFLLPNVLRCLEESVGPKVRV